MAIMLTNIRMYKLLLLFFCVFTAVDVFANCDRANKLYQQGKSSVKDPEGGLEKGLAFIEEALKLCRTDARIWYFKGKIHYEQKAYGKALIAYQQAKDEAQNSTMEARAIGRIAQVREAMDESYTAYELYDHAVALHPEPKPKWLKRALKKLDLYFHDDKVIQAEEIVSAISAKKSFTPQPAVRIRVNFDTDRFHLNDKALKQAGELGKALARLSYAGKVTVIGHTDKRASDAYNLVLSRKRAASVVDYLTRHYPSLSSKLCSLGKGETRLRYRGDSDEDHRLNRRVEVKLAKNCVKG